MHHSPEIGRHIEQGRVPSALVENGRNPRITREGSLGAGVALKQARCIRSHWPSLLCVKSYFLTSVSGLVYTTICQVFQVPPLGPTKVSQVFSKVRIFRC